MIGVTFLDEKTARSRLNGGEAVTRIYSKNKAYTGLQYSTRIYVGDYAFSNSIEALAQEASGLKRIGVCRMDVDNLGQAFVAGFERPEKATAQEREHFVTISRTAAFSRQMSLFFKCYINDILSGRFESKPALAVTVVYSGGDDVFLLGAWNDVVEAALRIRQHSQPFPAARLPSARDLLWWTIITRSASRRPPPAIWKTLQNRNRTKMQSAFLKAHTVMAGTRLPGEC